MKERIVEKDVNDANKQWFLEFAQEVLQNRALPDAEDGLIVAQRQLLWVMSKKLKMKATDSYKKSASLVGSTMATAYVHGDAALYDVLRNLSLPFVMRYPLIDPYGSVGTQESSDLFASSRYTEARPHKNVDLLIENFDKNTVDTRPTYTNEDYEPIVLPALFPNAIVNGHYGIGVSMSSSTLPHNLTEVCNAAIEYIKKNGKMTVEELMDFIKGPDFPTGGTVINGKDILPAFETGRSQVTLKIRGDYYIEGNKIIFTSIPYRTYRADIRKQLNKKLDVIERYFEDFNDYSQVGETKIVFEVKKGVSPEEAVEVLFQNTDLQSSVSYNNNYVYKGVPKMCSMLDLIDIYVKHQNEVCSRAATYDKDKAEKRAHILEGLSAVTSDIDKAIKLIKESANRAEARKALIDNFTLDEEQANAVLDLKLVRLTKLDVGEINKELEEKLTLIKECQKIISDKDYRNNILIKKIGEMRDQYGDARRTKIDNIAIKPKTKEKKEVPIVNVKVGVFSGNIIKTVKSDSALMKYSVNTRTDRTLYIFTDHNNCYKVKVEKLTDSAQELSKLCKMKSKENILAISEKESAKEVSVVTKMGLVKTSSAEEYSSTRPTSICKLNEGDAILAVGVDKKYLLMETTAGNKLNIVANEKITGRATKGNKAITMPVGVTLLNAKFTEKEPKNLGKRGQSGKK